MVQHTTRLKLETPNDNSYNSEWGYRLNMDMHRVEEAVWGYNEITPPADSDYTLQHPVPYPTGSISTWTTYDTSEAAQRVIKINTGAWTTGRNLIVPTPEGYWFIFNNTLYTLTVKTSGGTGVTILSGKKASVYSDGTNVLYAHDLTTLNGILPLSNGGTAATSAAGARTNLELGTSATQNTGSSGNTIPLLDGNNTWSGTNTFNSTLTSSTLNVNAPLTASTLSISASSNFTGPATFATNLNVNASLTSSTLSITATSNFTGASAFAGAATFASPVTINSSVTASTLSVSASSNFTNSVTFASTSNHSGTSNFSGPVHLATSSYAYGDIYTYPTSGASFTFINFGFANNIKINATQNLTLSASGTITPGQSGFIDITQDSTAGRTASWNAIYTFATGNDVSLSATGTDIFPYYIVSATNILVGQGSKRIL